MPMKFGCDPEFFIHDGVQFINAYGLFPGTKAEPFKLNKGAVQVDGMALEFNIDPAETEDEFNDNIETVLQQINEIMHNVDRNLKAVFVPVAEFEPNYFTLQPLESKILGCDPDFSVDGVEKTPDENALYYPMRTAAGHVHIGLPNVKDKDDPEHFETCKSIAKHFMDLKFFQPETDQEKLRTKMYGVPGSFRPKPYGVELRSPSNRWVENEDTRREMFRLLKTKMTELYPNEV